MTPLTKALRSKLDELLVDAHAVPDVERDEWAVKLAKVARAATLDRIAPDGLDVPLLAQALSTWSEPIKGEGDPEFTAWAEQMIRGYLRAAQSEAGEPATPEPDMDYALRDRMLAVAFQKAGEPATVPPTASEKAHAALWDGRVPGLIAVDGTIEATLIVGTDYRVTEIRSHIEPSGVEGEPDRETTVIRFDPVPVDALGVVLDRDSGRMGSARLMLLDDLGVALSNALGEGNPFEPYDRVYVLKTITAALDAARERVRAAYPNAAPESREPSL